MCEAFFYLQNYPEGFLKNSLNSRVDFAKFLETPFDECFFIYVLFLG